MRRFVGVSVLLVSGVMCAGIASAVSVVDSGAVVRGGDDFSVERRVLARFVDKTAGVGGVEFREGGDKARPEGFAILSAEGKVVIEAPTRRARLYGLGRHLREPAFRGGDAPVQSVRGIYFATHFGNWYDYASEREIRDYVEDLTLWGCNQVRVWFDMHDFNGVDDPRAIEKAKRLKTILSIARSCGLEPSLLVLSNEAFANSPEGLRADWRGGQNGYDRNLAGHYHVEICPSKPGGLKLILKQREAVLDLFSDISVGTVCIFPYDQGGCTCAACAPWGANGLFKILPPLSALIRRKLPGSRIEVATWYFDHFGALGEWKGFCSRAAEVRRCADLLSVERIDWLKAGNPIGLPVTSMAEISMWRMLPWGGFGANPCPKRLSDDVRRGVGVLAGYRPYSEGVYEDLNKVLFLRLGWNPKSTWQRIVGEYAAFHFGVADDAVAEAVSLLEDNQSHEAEIVQDGRRYDQYACGDVDVKRPFNVEFANGRPDRAKAARALELLTTFEGKLTPRGRAAWRWRILKLRAFVDARLAEGAALSADDLRAAFDELATIYRVGELTEPFLTPPGSRLRPGSRRAENVVIEATDFGVRESDCLQTGGLQAAIDEAGRRGGGVVRVPAGVYRTGGLVLRSGVTLELAEGAVLEGSRDPADYPGATHWHRALVRADGAADIGIVGGRFSAFNGMDAFDPAGEEGYRGPHGIMLTGCTNVTLRGYAVRDSGNWAHALFGCAKVRMSDVKVYGGHDACDFHDSEDVVVERCEFHTGDDSVAGFANRNCIVRDCLFDTSCQAVRMGGSDILFERCRLVHPASFANRGNLRPDEKRRSVKRGDGVPHGAAAGVIYYCDSRWEIDRPQGNIVFRDCDFDRPRQIFALDYDGRNMWCCRHPLESIAFEGCTFRSVEHPISIYGDGDRPLDFVFSNCTVSAAQCAGKRPLLTAYNYRRILLDGVRLEGFEAPHVVTRSRGEVTVRGGTPVRNVFRPDANDVILSFDEIAAALAKLPADEVAWRTWAAGVKTPDESHWNEEKGLYALPDDPFKGDGWGSAMAVLRGETPHAGWIGRAFCRQYKYFCGWDRTGAVSQTQRGEPSPLPAGAFGYALSLFDPLFARTFFTDFLRRKDIPPAAVAGARIAIEKIRSRKGTGKWCAKQR